MIDNIYIHKHIVFSTDHYNVLGLVRSLGEAGIRPIAIMVESHKVVMVSHCKYVDNVHIVKTKEEGLELLLKEYGSEPNKSFLYTCADDIESLVDLNYDKLVEHFYFFDGGCQGAITDVMPKKVLCELAESCGIEIPKTQIVDVGELPKSLRYPIMTKSTISTIPNWKGNVHICHNDEELKSAYEEIHEESIMLQEFIEKDNEFCLDGLSVNGGEEVYLPLQCKYLKMTDMSYGTYMLFEKYAEPDLMPKIKELIKKTHFTGIFSMEFLIDKQGNFFFLEINFRHSTWGYAYTYAGFNLPVIYAQSVLAGHLVLDSVKEISRPFTAMVEFTHFKDFVIGRRESLFEYIKEIHNTDCFYYWNKKDQKPFWRILLHKMHLS